MGLQACRGLVVGTVVLCSVTCAPASGQNVYNSKTGLSYGTIQAAIDATGDVSGTGGVTIEIRDSATYSEQLVINTTKVQNTSAADPLTIKARDGVGALRTEPTVRATTGPAITIDGVNYVTFEGLRIFMDTGGSGYTAALVGSTTAATNITFRNCVMYRGYWGAGFWNASTGGRVENCTFYTGTTTWGSSAGCVGFLNTATGGTVRNCLFYVQGGSAVNQKYAFWVVAGAQGGFTSNYNTVYQVDSSVGDWAGVWGATGYRYMFGGTSWNNASTQDANSLTDNPFFSNLAETAAGDFHLRSPVGRWDPGTQTYVTTDTDYSPCIDVGTGAVGNEPAPNGAILNQGAYGGTYHASKSRGAELVSSTALSPVITAGDVDVAIMYVTLLATGAITLTEVRFTFTGSSTVTDADISEARVVVSDDTIYGDADDVLLGFDATTDIVTSGASVSGVVSIPSGVTRYIYLVLSFSGTAGGKNVQIDEVSGGAARAAYTITGGSVSGDANFVSNLLAIATPVTSKFNVSGRVDSIAGETVVKGVTYTFLAVQIGSWLQPTLDRVVVLVNGTGLTNADIDTLDIYVSDDAYYNAGDTAFLTGIAYDGATASVGVEYTADGTNYQGAAGASYYLLFRVSIAAGATAGRGVKVSVAVADATDSTNKFVVVADAKQATNFPYESSEKTIALLLTVAAAGADYNGPTGIQAAINSLSGALATPVLIQVLDNATYNSIDIPGTSAFTTSAANTLTIRSRAGNWATITPTVGDDPCVYLNVGYVILERFVLTGAFNSGGPTDLEQGIRVTALGDNVTLRNLLVHKNNDAEIQINSDNVTVENCTLYHDTSAANNGPYCLQVKTAPVGTGHTLRSNILVLNVNYAPVDLTATSDIASSNYNLIYNMFAGAPGSLFRVAGTYRNFGWWKAQTVHDDQSLEADPLFVTVGTDYHVRSRAAHRTGGPPGTASTRDATASSPCIDAGDPTSSYAKETEDNGNRINMGAFGNTEEASRSYQGITPTYGTNAPLAYNYWMGTSTGTWGGTHWNWSQGDPLVTDESRARVRIDVSNTQGELDGAGPGPNLSPAVTASVGVNCYSFGLYSGTLTIGDADGALLDVREGGVTLGGGTLSFTGAGASSITDRGNWTESGGATFTPTTGTVTFNGTAAQTITGLSTNNFFYVTITNASVAGVTGTLRVAGDWSDSAGTFQAGSGTVTFMGTATQTITTASTNRFFNLSVSGATAATVQTPTAAVNRLDVRGALSVSGVRTLRINSGDTLVLSRIGAGFPPDKHTISGDAILELVSGTAALPVTTVQLGDFQQLEIGGTATLRTVAGAEGYSFASRYVYFTRAGGTGGYSIHIMGSVDIDFVKFEYLYGRSTAGRNEFTQGTVESALALSGGSASLDVFARLWFDLCVDPAGPNARFPRYV
ncbi:MAG: hypothetical protein HY720_32165 [Planctomycetes bacterium]|nr:hypothetical protein [Planctomycetota bacterium]